MSPRARTECAAIIEAQGMMRWAPDWRTHLLRLERQIVKSLVPAPVMPRLSGKRYAEVRR